MTENWKAVAGYEGLYEVSDEGSVRSLNFNHTGKTKLLKLEKARNGYLRVVLHKDVTRKRMLVHRLVAEAFIPNPQNLETVNHRDEDKQNNSASNLEWMSMADNIIYSNARPVQQFDKQGNLLATFISAHEAGRVTGIRYDHICECCNGKRKSAGGFKWRSA